MQAENHFTDRLIEAIKQKNAQICVGLDPRIDHIPNFKGEGLEAIAESLLEFNKGIIDSVYDLVPAVKPQFAFYLQYGFQGVRAFQETCLYAKEKGLMVIADAKCNDIGRTAEAYAHAFLELFDCDAVTVNPYLGYDGVKPFIEICKKKGKGIFVLVKTSNQSSGDFQDRITEDKLRNYEVVAHLLESWGADEKGKYGYTSVGAVVGATHPDEAARLRKLMPHAYFLVPGYGAQGGTAADVKVCFNKDGLGALVNSSRDIIFAWEAEAKKAADSRIYERNYGQAAREAVLKMKKELTL